MTRMSDASRAVISAAELNESRDREERERIIRVGGPVAAAVQHAAGETGRFRAEYAELIRELAVRPHMQFTPDESRRLADLMSRLGINGAAANADLEAVRLYTQHKERLANLEADLAGLDVPSEDDLQSRIRELDETWKRRHREEFAKPKLALIRQLEVRQRADNEIRSVRAAMNAVRPATRGLW